MVEPYSEEWYKEVAELHATREAEGLQRWTKLINSLFPVGLVRNAVWDDMGQIVDILDHIGRVSNTNHVFCPRGGGFDLTGAEPAGEYGCIALLSDGTATIIKPDKLTFHAFGSDSSWYYFRIETKQLKPSGVYEWEPEQYEELCEVSPGEYEPRSVWDYGVLGEDYFEDSRPVIREFGGSFVVFAKYSTYNKDSSSYDGRHNRGSAELFAEYIRSYTDEEAI